MADDIAALSTLRLDWAPAPEDVWRPSPFHIDGLHPAVTNAVLDGLYDAKHSNGSSPLGFVLQGPPGSGKTHLLGWLREQTQRQGGYFFLVRLLTPKRFWECVLASMLEGLTRPVSADGTQLKMLLRRLAAQVGAAPGTRRAVTGEVEITVDTLNDFVRSLDAYDSYVARSCQDTARALALSASAEPDHRDIADDYFSSVDEATPGTRRTWGMRTQTKTAEELIGELSRLVALTGPAVIAVDQVDTLIAQSRISADQSHQGAAAAAEDWQQALVLEYVAGGLMSLRELTRRTLTVLACLPTSWTAIKTKATGSVQDRFRETRHLTTIDDETLARLIIEKRFTGHYAHIGHTPPYPSWPVARSAFRDAADLTPRQLLQRVDEHLLECRIAGKVTELTTFRRGGLPDTREASPTSPPTLTPEQLAELDNRFEQFKVDADIDAAIDPGTEDSTVPELLAAALTAWTIERAVEAFTQDPPPGPRPALHARLRLTLDDRIEDEVHWSFRAVSDHHHGNAALHRIQQACLAAGVHETTSKRKLFLLRNQPWSSSTATRKAVAEFEHAGGRTLPLDNEDLRILFALRELMTEDADQAREWIVSRQPTQQISLLQDALADTDTWTATTTAHDTPASDAHQPRILIDQPPGSGQPTVEPPALTVGAYESTNIPARLELAALRKHIAIFAGSGSGKTVLIRRIVEECALQGVSSIVLDPNNDLARMGDEWPEPPSRWQPDDPAKARDYLDNTDVVVWTPRRTAGRPLTFQPLPDFAATLEDPDEFALAVETAVASLATRAKIDGRTTKSHISLAVLRRAIEHYAKQGGNSLHGLIETLADFPDDIANLADAGKIAHSLAQTLTAATINDPMFGGHGTAMDPGMLLTPPSGKRARISIISMIGLPSEELRQNFVNQLQMALFAWIKLNPAADRPLLGLLVMDEAQTLAPSGALTACTQSTLALAAQARKYGLGLIFATQAPKGLHNRIAGNAATQFYGLLNSPIQVEAAREMSRAKGGDVPDISRLRTGEFYLAAEGDTPNKIRTQMCLSHHPAAPLTTEEVIKRAQDDHARDSHMAIVHHGVVDHLFHECPET